MAQPLYVNGAICTYATATDTIAPTTGLEIDGKAQSSALPQTVIATPSVSGLYLITVYMRYKPDTLGVAMTVCGNAEDCALPSISNPVVGAIVSVAVAYVQIAPFT